MPLLRSYGTTLAIVICIWLFGFSMPFLAPFIDHAHDHVLLQVFFSLSLLFLLSFFVGVTSRLTNVPSFVYALLFGVLTKPALEPIIQNSALLSAIVALGATLILFGGGLEVPYKNFLRLSPKIISLSFVGLGLTALLFSQSLTLLGPISPAPLSIATMVLLGAILASTDPAAIIPILKSLRFKNRDIKDIIISESAVTDVTGTLLTNVFLGFFATGAVAASVFQGYQALLSQNTGVILLEEIIFGIVAGVLGFFILDLLHRRRKSGYREDAADIAFFLGIPILTFFLAAMVGGSGYLAAFITGLIMHLTEHLHETEHFFNNLIDAFLKPIIFLLLGALVNFEELFQYAGIGIAAALIFMFVIRPLTVMISLAPWFFMGKDRITFKEALFISFVRETGAIPAVLLVAVVSSGLQQDLRGLVPVGMWVIIATLVLQPPLTPPHSESSQSGRSHGGCGCTS